VLPWDDDQDFGKRPLPDPLPAGRISYLSQSIQIYTDGNPYTGGNLPRKRPTIIRVKVANWGDKDTSAQITLWWAVPTPVFSRSELQLDYLSPDPPSVWVYVPRRDGSGKPSIKVTEPFTLVPPDDMPDHVCLLAEITAGDAGAGDGGAPDPFGNRHYAQHNLDLVDVGLGKMSAFSFMTANPFEAEARVLVRLKPVTGAALRSFARIYLAEPAELPASAFRLQLVEAGDRQYEELAFNLAARERRLCHGIVSLRGLQPGQFSAGEVQSTIVSSEGNDRQERRGSLGVIVFPAG
jgi:hypothetical protein